LAGHRNREAAGRLLFEPLLSGLNDLIKGRNVDLPILPSQVPMDDRIQLPQDFPQFGVEVVLDAVVTLAGDLCGY
jgi:hypothetical protein